ncbi:hypothetical protein [Rubinisphaera margarita]|uniref:hypothetical protein n=1 Tax=Rubinisphaera margarita TaxID=2909586 RepID=UPI001EE98A39|nr:hypothetical protein [Rubinisphaera margarita]MCG6154827.1 hypothetical protein [Rubinisphaera margarita]
MFWKLLPMCCVLLFTGCTSLNFASMSLPFMSYDKTHDSVIEILSLWQPGEGRDSNGMPCRGFAGQILFFTQGRPAPVKITGDVKVYVFDDQGTVDEQQKPLHIYEFEEGAWKAYETKSNIGWAYQVFIPYPRAGTHQAVCSLRVKHISKRGQVTLSDPADIMLAGRVNGASPKSSVTHAEIVPQVDPQAPQPGTMQVTTIRPPRKMQPVVNTGNTSVPAQNPAAQPQSASVIADAYYSEEVHRGAAPASDIELASWNSPSPHRQIPAPVADPPKITHPVHPLKESAILKENVSVAETAAVPLFHGQHPLAGDGASQDVRSQRLKVQKIVIE